MKLVNGPSRDLPVNDWSYRASPYGFGQLRHIGIAGPGLLLIFGMLSLPAGFQSLKLVLLAVVTVQIVLKAIRRRSFFIHNAIFLIFVFYIAIGLLYTTLGLINGNSPNIFKTVAAA